VTRNCLLEDRPLRHIFTPGEMSFSCEPLVNP